MKVDVEQGQDNNKWYRQIHTRNKQNPAILASELSKITSSEKEFRI